MAIDHIENLEPGLSVRNKLNAVIDEVNSFSDSGEPNRLDNRGAGVQIALPDEAPILPIRTLLAASTKITIGTFGDVILFDVAPADIDHNDLGGIAPNDHHNQVHALVGTDHSDVGTLVAPTERDLLQFEGGLFELGRRLNFVRPYVLGPTYYKDDTVADGAWTMVANKETTERAAPQPVGEAQYAYQGASPTASQLAKQIISGTRYSFPQALYVTGYRFYTVAGNEYAVFAVEDPLGTPIQRELTAIIGAAEEWVEVSVPPFIIAGGAVVDLVVMTVEPDPTPATFTGDWSYLRTGSAQAPIAGQVTHGSTSSDLLSISKTDNSAADRSAELAALTIGDIIEADGLRWSIQSIADSGTYYDFGVAPATRLGSNSVYTFLFETVVATPITHVEDVNYWLAEANVTGLFVADGGYDMIATDDNAYGADLLLQDVDISADWDVLALSGGAGGGGGGFTPTTFTGIGTTGYVPDPGAGTTTRVMTADGLWAEPVGGGGGEANDGANVGGQAEVFRNKTGVNLNFRTLLGANGITASVFGDTVIIDGSGVSPVTDHGSLTGLLDDDHTQYHTDARGDLRYPQLGDYNAHVGDGSIHFSDAPADGSSYVRNNNAWTLESGGGGVTDHGALTGLGDDDHTQYHNDARGDARYTPIAHQGDATIHFTEASIDHTAIQNTGTNDHAAIDMHIADATVHFTEASIVHQNISGAGTNDHAAIDTHISSFHIDEAPNDGQEYVRKSEAWAVVTASGVSTFLGLTDVVPANYTGRAGQIAAVNNGETGLDFDQPINLNRQPLFNVLTLDLDGQAAEYTVRPDDWIGIGEDHSYSYDVLVGTVLPAVVSYSGTHTLKIDGSPFGMATLFASTALIKNDNTIGTIDAFGPTYVLLNQTKIEADTNAIALNPGFAINDNVTFRTSNGGTLTATNYYTSLICQPVIEDGVTLAGRSGVTVSNSTGAGTVENNVGVNVQEQTRGTISNYGVLIGNAANSVPEAGNFGLYQQTTELNKLKGNFEARSGYALGGLGSGTGNAAATVGSTSGKVFICGTATSQGLWVDNTGSGYVSLRPSSRGSNDAQDALRYHATEHRFQTGSTPTERMRILSGGQVTIGGDYTETANTLGLKEISGSTNIFQCESTTAGDQEAFSVRGTQIRMSNSSLPVASDIDVHATVENGAWGLKRATSSIVYKQNVTDTVKGLAEIMALRVVDFEYKTQPGLQQTGMIAEEVDLIPELKNIMSYGIDGQIEGFRSRDMVGILVKAMQEQQAILNDYEARLNALENP